MVKKGKYMKDLTKEEQEKLYIKIGEIIEGLEGNCQRRTVEDIGTIVLSEIRTAVERERENTLNEIVESARTYLKLCTHKKYRKGLCKHDIVHNRLMAIKHKLEYISNLTDDFLR